MWWHAWILATTMIIATRIGRALFATAKEHKATLMTTEKDYMRLDAEQRRKVIPLPLRLVLSDTAWVMELLAGGR